MMNLAPALIFAVAASGLSSLLSPNGIGGLLPIFAIILLFYFMIIRPQQRRAREHATRVEAVKRGDTVVLSSGMIGKVVRVEEKEVGVEIAQNVTVKVVKAMIAEVRARGEPAAANDAKA
jgi:preprotein translocase subunit YajC